jgi:NADPH:quinone reductase-like Zn-dependent oxidoreductase
LQGLRDHGQLQAGQKVLINGAAGGVGTFAVQIAKALGAEVTAVVSTRKVALTRSLGADRVIDYTQEDFTQNGQRYDLIFDTAGNRKVAEYQQALMPTGTFVTTTFLPALMFRGLRSSKPNDPKDDQYDGETGPRSPDFYENPAGSRAGRPGG